MYDAVILQDLLVLGVDNQDPSTERAQLEFEAHVQLAEKPAEVPSKHGSTVKDSMRARHIV